MKPDHKAAKKWAHDVWGTLKDIALHEVLETNAINHRNIAACYLDAMAQLDKAEKVCEAFHRCRVISRVTKDGRTVTAIEDQARVQELYEAYTDYQRRKEIAP